MRTFIAIELPEEIKDGIAELQEQLKSSSADVKWVSPQNIHLTLKFLGEIDEKRLEEINKVIHDAVSSKAAFHLSIYFIGAFPKIDSPRVIWLGIDSGDKETKEIAKSMEEELRKIGFPEEDRPFSSHITLGRTRSGLNRQKLVQSLKSMEGKVGEKKLEFDVTKVTLFKSTLTQKGPIYEALKETHLKTA